MKKTISTLLCILLFSSAIGLASKPSELTIQFVVDRVSALAENPESSLDEMQLAQALQDVTRQHGIEGIAWLGYKEPLILESNIAEDSLGLRNISVALLKQANSGEEMYQMLLALVSAQVRNSIDPFSEEHIAWLKEGCMASSIRDRDVLADQLIAEALVAGSELDETQVEAATYNRRINYYPKKNFDLCKLIIKKIGYTCFIPKWEKCISEHLPKKRYWQHEYSYSYEKKSSHGYSRFNWRRDD